MHRRAPFLAAVLAALALALPAAASAGTTSDDGDTVVVIVGNATVPAGKVAEGVFVASGDARIAGRVKGDVIVANGDTLVAGSVEGDVVNFSGRARLLRSARVGGDVRYGEEHPVVSPLARVDGHVTDEDWTDSVDFLPVLGGFLIWLGVGLSLLVLGGLALLIAPRAADAMYERSRERVGPLIAIGIAILVALPIVAVLAGILLFGIPLALLILLAMAPLCAIAYVASAFALGRRLVKPPAHRALSFLAGLVILRALAFVPVVGAVAGLAAVIFGLGLIGAAIGAARDPKPAAQAQIPGI